MLAFASGIGGTDNAGSRGAQEELVDAIKLLLCFISDSITPLRWNHGKLLHLPWLAPGRVHLFGFGDGDQMAKGIGHLIIVAFEIAILLLVGPKYGGDVAGDGWFFCKNDDHWFDSFSSVCWPCVKTVLS